MRSVCLLVLLVAAPAAAAELRRGEDLVIGKDEVVEGDLYAVASTLRVEGTVRGDLIALARTVTVSGRVEQDLLVAAGETRVTGEVGGSIRATAGTLELSGRVGQDAAVAGGEVILGRSGEVRQDLMAAGGKLRVLGPVGGTARVAADELLLDAAVAGDVRARAGTFTVGERAGVAGLLSYAASGPVSLSERARLGKVERQPAPARLSPAAAFLLGWLRLAVGLFALGLLFRLVAPRWSRSAVSALRTAPGRSVAFGALALLAAPLLAVLIFLVGGLVGGWWIGFIVLGALALGLALTFPLVGLLAGEWAAGRFGKGRGRLALPLAGATLALGLALRVPLLGVLVGLAVVLFGLGALLLGGWNLRRLPAAA